MARPATFDPDTALEQAMQVFWRRGYEATSIRDLVAATGVNRYSLYHRWSDKRGLYFAALEHYARTVGAEWLGSLQHGSDPLGGIRSLFATLETRVTSDPERLGCFALNTALELGTDDQARAMVRMLLDIVQDHFEQALRQAVELGQLGPETDTAAHARHLAVSMQAVLLQARAAAPPQTVHSFIALTLSTLEAP